MKNGEVLLIALLLIGGGAAIYIALKSKAPEPKKPSTAEQVGAILKTPLRVAEAVGVGVSQPVSNYGVKGVRYVNQGVQKATSPLRSAASTLTGWL